MKVALITNDKERRLEKILWKVLNNLPIHLIDYTSEEFLSQSYEKRWLTYSQLMTHIALPDDGFQGFNLIIKTNINTDIAWTVSQEYASNSEDKVYLIGFNDNKFFDNSKIKNKLLFNSNQSDLEIEELIKKEI